MFRPLTVRRGAFQGINRERATNVANPKEYTALSASLASPERLLRTLVDGPKRLPETGQAEPVVNMGIIGVELKRILIRHDGSDIFAIGKVDVGYAVNATLSAPLHLRRNAGEPGPEHPAIRQPGQPRLFPKYHCFPLLVCVYSITGSTAPPAIMRRRNATPTHLTQPRCFCQAGCVTRSRHPVYGRSCKLG
jgi:hypothetical protein